MMVREVKKKGKRGEECCGATDVAEQRMSSTNA